MFFRALSARLSLLLVLAACILQVPASEAGPGSSGSANEAITAVLKRQQAYWNQGDVSSFMIGYWKSPDLTFAGSSGISRGWDSVLARYQRTYPDKTAMGQLEFSELEVRLLGEKSALVLGKWHLRRSSGDIGGVFSLVFQQFPDGWKIIHDHTSQVVAKTP
jgi:ketosteroid isomerase-like protein